MDLYANVWYDENQTRPIGPVLLPGVEEADLLIHELVNKGWYKIEILDESLKVTHTITQVIDGWELEESSYYKEAKSEDQQATGITSKKE